MAKWSDDIMYSAYNIQWCSTKMRLFPYVTYLAATKVHCYEGTYSNYTDDNLDLRTRISWSVDRWHRVLVRHGDCFGRCSRFSCLCEA
jgi:hypothetical protein